MVYTFEPDSVRKWLANHRPDMVSSFEHIMSPPNEFTDPSAQAALQTLIAIGFAAGRMHEREALDAQTKT